MDNKAKTWAPGVLETLHAEHASGVSLRRVAMARGLDPNTLKAALVRAGLSVRGRPSVSADEAVRLFREPGATLTSVAKTLGVNRSVVRSRLVACGAFDPRPLHGLSKRPEYVLWRSAKSRCVNPRDARFSDYGGRGITMHWRSFPEFFAAVGPRPTKDHSLDRIDNDRGYEPGNVRWATRHQQQVNRRDTPRYTYRGETLSVAEWARRTGFNIAAIRSRIVDAGWSIRDALTLVPNRSKTAVRQRREVPVAIYVTEP